MKGWQENIKRDLFSYEALISNFRNRIKDNHQNEFDSAIILGSGLGAVATELGELIKEYSYSEILDIPAKGVEGHEHRLLIVQTPQKKNLLIFCGRYHYYEGYHAGFLGLPVVLSYSIGIKNVISTCAAGAINDQLSKGDLVYIIDHINLSGINPLAYALMLPEQEKFASFPSCYRQDVVDRIAERHSAVKKGVYAWVSGPAYETRAEIRMLRSLGADIVGMSMVPEAIFAASLKMNFIAFACVTNIAGGIADNYPDHREVLQNACLCRPKLVETIKWINQKEIW